MEPDMKFFDITKDRIAIIIPRENKNKKKNNPESGSMLAIIEINIKETMHTKSTTIFFIFILPPLNIKRESKLS